ncbi:hypothetical protein PP178_06235 [Zeaxanthinibacter sp. PT1]|uniref:hypothetical protein n=1 Tax=Zeaxanthinibacter TaxID=561554 RepID=UPI0023495D09|nr:hypothetical protein [Zeaxanthinibacter sp. PT1]MDC6351146.1 hypothetical protein [Zeaxanthinibacter sp. PT1]
MSKKQGEENTEFVKEEATQTRKYIFQKNSITKIAVIIVAAFLVLLLIGLYVSGVFLETP